MTFVALTSKACSPCKTRSPFSKRQWGLPLIKAKASRLISFSLSLAMLLPGCGKRAADDSQEKSGTPAVAEVTVTKVRRGLLEQDLFVSGNVAALPNRDAKVAALVGGRIARVLVGEGDRVRAGQPLAELENAPLKDQELQAEAAVVQARANLENARLAAQRNESLLQRGIASRKEVEDSRTQLAVNEATLRQVEATLSNAKTQLARSVVRSPFEGVIVHRFLGAGEQVDGTSSQPIVEIAQLDTLELLGNVPASRLSEVRAGEEFTFQSDAVPDTNLKARVVAILPAVDPATNNGTVRIRIDNRAHRLKLGTFLSVQLPVKQKRPRLIVPRQAIYPDENGEPHVYRVNGDEATFVAVQVGLQTNDQAEILAGVQEGDTIVLSGGYGLAEKSKVHVKS